MAIETQQISADNVIETETRIFASPGDLDKLGLLNITGPTDIDYILNKVDAIQNPIQDMGEFDPTIDGQFPTGAMSGWLYRVVAEGNIGIMTLNVGDTIFAISDIVDRTDSSLWVKIDNTESSDILRAGDINPDPTFVNASDEFVPSQGAVKTYVDTMVMDLNDQLMAEIELITGGVGGTSRVEVSDWVTIALASNGTDSQIDLLDIPGSIIRIYIEGWGDIVDGWSTQEGIPAVFFADDIDHVTKRCKVTYLMI